MIKCIFENGHEVNLRHVTMDNVVVKDGKLLVVRRTLEQITCPGKLALPGGFLDRNESTQQGVLRELLEETGYKGKIIALFRVIDRPNRPGEDRQNVGFEYLVEVGEGAGKGDKESSEILWLDLGKLPSKEEFAFDHFETIEYLLKYLKKPFKLPVFG